MTKTDAVSVAADRLNSARLALADAKATAQRIAARARDVQTDADAAEQAAIRAAGNESPDDDAAALRSLTEARARLDTTRQASERAELAVQDAERAVNVAARALDDAQAASDLNTARAAAAEIDPALSALIAACHGVTGGIESARRRVVSRGGNGLQINPVIGRRIRHALQAAGVNVGDDGPRAMAPENVSRLVVDAIDTGAAAFGL